MVMDPGVQKIVDDYKATMAAANDSMQQIAESTKAQLAALPKQMLAEYAEAQKQIDAFDERIRAIEEWRGNLRKMVDSLDD